MSAELVLGLGLIAAVVLLVAQQAVTDVVRAQRDYWRGVAECVEGPSRAPDDLAGTAPYLPRNQQRGDAR